MQVEWFKVFVNSIDLLNDESGVYVISVLLKSGKYGAVYVGQSENLRQRISQHFSDSESNKELKEYIKKDYTFKISYAKVQKDNLDLVEKYLINYYHPRFNSQDGIDDLTIEINLPNVVKFL